jgi:cytochrome oxidase Cu insertion factor (SCO1/SenC/PrrC family)
MQHSRNTVNSISPVPARTRYRRALVLIVVLVICGIAINSSRWRSHASHSRERPEFSGLIDQRGRHFDPTLLAGQYKLIYFGSTDCSNPCQTAMSSLALALRDLGEAADRVQAIYVTVDPERDTPQRLNFYLRQFGVPIIGLTGTTDAVTHVANDFGVDLVPSSTRVVANAASNNTYFLVTPDGVLLVKLSGTSPAATLATQLRTLLDVIAT